MVEVINHTKVAETNLADLVENHTEVVGINLVDLTEDHTEMVGINQTNLEKEINLVNLKIKVPEIRSVNHVVIS